MQYARAAEEHASFVELVCGLECFLERGRVAGVGRSATTARCREVGRPRSSKYSPSPARLTGYSTVVMLRILPIRIVGAVQQDGGKDSIGRAASH